MMPPRTASVRRRAAPRKGNSLLLSRTCCSLLRAQSSTTEVSMNMTSSHQEFYTFLLLSAPDQDAMAIGLPFSPISKQSSVPGSLKQL